MEDPESTTGLLFLFAVLATIGIALTVFLINDYRKKDDDDKD